ncbi:LysR substrate-binding domain-containing protein [Streptomyces sp. CAU 1734]|uniref:LysR substrate-binding domain-containing protein n=1 Tax=Streptomyces sp. CAU 1734 TaxID=3140360 RepID=UPI0032607CDC
MRPDGTPSWTRRSGSRSPRWRRIRPSRPRSRGSGGGGGGRPASRVRAGRRRPAPGHPRLPRPAPRRRGADRDRPPRRARARPALLADRVDIALLTEPDREMDLLSPTPLFEDEMVAVVPARHPWAARPPPGPPREAGAPDPVHPAP